MQKTIAKHLVLLGLLATIGNSYAQNACSTHSKGITTDPDNPVSTEKPSKLNNFDWIIERYSVNTNHIVNFGNPITSILSPFFKDDNFNIGHFLNNKDMKVEDGWELVKYDFGTPEHPTDYVYMVLYNKYQCKLRVFLTGSPVGEYFNRAKISLFFNTQNTNGDTYYSSVLSNISQIFALDEFKTEPNITTISRYVNGLEKWFYADFAMAYDPCTCLFESELLIDVKLIKEASITLKGSLQGDIASITQNSGEVKRPGFSVNNLIAAGQSATKAYESIDRFRIEQQAAFR